MSTVFTLHVVHLTDIFVFSLLISIVGNMCGALFPDFAILYF